MVITFVVLFEMNRLIRDKIGALATANSDSVQWSLAQSDVELLALQATISDAIADPAVPVSTVRTRFDIFYSRAHTLSTSPLFDEVRKDPEMGLALGSIEDYLENSVTLIDSDDQTLRDALPRLRTMTSEIRNDVRNFNMKGVSVLSRVSDTQRTQTAETLNLAAIMILAFFFILIVMLGLLVYLFRRSQLRTVEQSLIRARLAAIVSTSLDAVVAVNKSGAIIDFNGAAEQIFGYTREEVVGRQMEDVIVPDHLKDAHRSGMERYSTTGVKHVIGKGRVQLEARRKNGEIFPVELSIASADSEEGEIFVSFLRDISRRIEAEQDLIKARDDAVAGEKAKADLIAVMSHEMRTPLNGMLGTLQLIDPSNLSAKEKEYIGIIGASGKLLLHHVDNVLEISRAEAGKMEVADTVFSVRALISELVESQRSVAEHRGNTLVQIVDTEMADFVRGDPTRVRQIILNLIGNAIKFTRNGSITVEAKHVPETKMVGFRVTDTGIGIAQEDRARIFEEFVTLDASYSREVGGTGLGLAIVKRLVEAMGGEVGLDSAEATGSSFWVHLPLPAETVETTSLHAGTAQSEIPEMPKLSPMKILVVEDNRINRIVVRDLLEKDGHHVDEAVDGEQGLQSAQASTYDLILMDISMPVMDGLEATKAIRKSEAKGQAVPIIALTAHAMPAEKERFLAAGMNDIVTKPVSRQKLRDILQGISDNQSRSADNSGMSAPDPAGEIIDHIHLNELASTLGEEKTSALIEKFLSEMENDVARIIAEIDGGQVPQDLRSKVHHAAGSAALLGAKSLHATLAGLETQLHDLESGDTISSNELASTWAETVEHLEKRARTI